MGKLSLQPRDRVQIPDIDQNHTTIATVLTVERGSVYVRREVDGELAKYSIRNVERIEKGTIY